MSEPRYNVTPETVDIVRDDVLCRIEIVCKKCRKVLAEGDIASPDADDNEDGIEYETEYDILQRACNSWHASYACKAHAKSKGINP